MRSVERKGRKRGGGKRGFGQKGEKENDPTLCNEKEAAQSRKEKKRELEKREKGVESLTHNRSFLGETSNSK